ncbi:MAG: hypothetical protein K6L73_10135 [Cellvibrionaceae bacterium]
MTSTNLDTDSWQYRSIINAAKSLLETGGTSSSTGQQIAAALALNRVDLLPRSYRDSIDAWDYLEPSWQQLVRIARTDSALRTAQ